MWIIILMYECKSYVFLSCSFLNCHLGDIPHFQAHPYLDLLKELTKKKPSAGFPLLENKQLVGG
jgi:hypothetical protein